MGKNGISKKRDVSWSGKPRILRPDADVRPYDPTITLRDPVFIRKAILEALEAGDFESVVQIYRAHLRVLNRTRSAEALKVSRQAVHKMLKTSYTPSLRTFTRFMKVLRDRS